MMSDIGKMFTLISMKDIRYTGILETVRIQLEWPIAYLFNKFKYSNQIKVRFVFRHHFDVVVLKRPLFSCLRNSFVCIVMTPLTPNFLHSFLLLCRLIQRLK
jgi:hypothetical protein